MNTDYDKAVTQFELALRRTADKLRKGGETNIEDALWMLADEIADLAEETRRVSLHHTTSKEI